MRIRILCNELQITGTLDDTPSARLLWDALPFTSTANTWGQEVYFSAPVSMPLDAAPKVVVPPGTICFWVQGSALALPFGPTPVSEHGECRLITAVNTLGHIDGDPRILANISEGDSITVERAELP